MMEIGLCHKITIPICLDRLNKGDKIILTGFTDDCPYDLKKWFVEHRFVKGTEVSIHAVSPFNDPVAYHIHQSVVVLRKDESKYLEGFLL